VESRAAQGKPAAPRPDVGKALTLAIEVDGHAKLSPDPFAKLVRTLTAKGERCSAERNDGEDVGRADAWVDAAMLSDVDLLDRSSHGGDKRFDKVRAQPGERDHRAVVVRVGVDVEDVRLASPRGIRDGGDDRIIPALREVGD